MWKKLLSLNLVLILLLTLLPMGVLAAEYKGYLRIHLNDGSGKTVEISRDLSSGGDLGLFEYDTDHILAEEAVVTSYNSAADGSGKSYALSTPIEELESTDENAFGEVYAQWTQVKPDYIFYYGAGLAQTGDGKEYLIQEDLDLTQPITLAGEYTFTDADGRKVLWWMNGKERYAPGEKVTLEKSTMFLPYMGLNQVNFHYRNWSGEMTGVYSLDVTTSWQSINLPFQATWESSQGIFVGWNDREDGGGAWYTTQQNAAQLPEDLYAQYKPRPAETEYVILKAFCGLQNGQTCDILEFDSDGRVTLPTELSGGRKVAYWTCWRNAVAYTYPAGKPVTLASETELSATPVYEGTYYCLIDGAGGQTADGSVWVGASCYVTSSGDLNITSFRDLDTFLGKEAILVGYRGGKSNTLYEVDTEIKPALEREAEDWLACFTAEYESARGGYIQYMGNGAKTMENKAFFVQDGLDFEQQNGAVLADNQFKSPEGTWFLGWRSAKGDWYMPGDTIEFTENTVLYAQWGTRRVTYHYTGVSGLAQSYMDFRGSEVLEFGEQSRDGFVLLGWNTNPEGTGDWYCTGDRIPDGTVMELYEQWLKLPEERNYYLYVGSRLSNGRMAQVIDMEAESELVTLPLLPTNSGIGWIVTDWSDHRAIEGFLDENESYIFQPGSQVTVNTGDVIQLFAPKHLTYLDNLDGVERVYYNANPSSDANLVLWEGTEVFPDVAENNVFQSWNTRADGSGAGYGPGSVVESGLTFYAQWKERGSSEPVTPSPTPPYVPTPSPTLSVQIPDVETDRSSVPAAGGRATVTQNAEGEITKLRLEVEDQEKTVTLQQEIPVARDLAEAVEIEIVLPTRTTNVTVELTVPKASASTVLVLVHEDGREEILPKTMQTKNGVSISLDGSATLKLVDRAKLFADTGDPELAWAEEAIEFVAARELFDGTQENVFEPQSSMNRAMLAAVLWRLEGCPVVEAAGKESGDEWYAAAMQWANDAGILLGYGNDVGAEDPVTREQLAVLLYRLSGEPEVRNHIQVKDASSWAAEAMSWALETGLLRGDGSTLDPQGVATRAQVAVILQRYVNGIGKQ